MIVKVDAITEQDWYNALVEDCQAIFTEAIFNHHWTLVEGYHKIGERIATENNLDRASVYGKKILKRVSKSLGKGERTIYKAIQFYEKYPDLDQLPMGKNITWRKVCNELLPKPKEDEPENIVDPLDELLDKWKVSAGQVWQLGEHRIMCGDAYDQIDINTLLENWHINALITDPPYGIDYQPNWNKWDGSPSDYSAIMGDEAPFDPQPFMGYPTVVLFGANYFNQHLPQGGWICWDKRTDEKKDAMIGSPFELAWYRSVNTTKKAMMVRVLHGGVVNSDSINGNNEKRLHPTQKPIKLFQHILQNLTLPDETIYDPFVGVGSVLLACEEEGRRCLAMEIEPKYVAAVLERWVLRGKEQPHKIGE